MLMGNMSRILEVRFVRTSSGIIFCHQERPALARFVLQREATEAVTCQKDLELGAQKDPKASLHSGFAKDPVL